MATIAVFVALGGGAYAAVKLPKNSVGAKQLKKNSVTGAKVKNGSLLRADFRAGQLPAGPAGTAGAKGDAGPAGAPGKDGANAATTVVYRRAETSVAPGGFDAVSATCQAGERMIGGGGGWIQDTNDGIALGYHQLGYSGPAAGLSATADQAQPNSWRLSGQNKNSAGGGAQRLAAYAICASP
jgi:hypothetical protein